jgi:hypothetical protein
LFIKKGVAVGLALKNLVASSSYHIHKCTHSWLKLDQQIGHGCIILLQGGSLYSHCNKEENNVTKDFKYEVGEEVCVETHVNELLFKNETKNTEYKMNLSLTEDEWKQAHFCVLLHPYNCSISILWKMEHEYDKIDNRRPYMLNCIQPNKFVWSWEG